MNDLTNTLYLIRGLPGAGKSTFADSLKQFGVVSNVFEADMYFELFSQYLDKAPDSAMLADAHAWCLRKTKDTLLKGLSVAVANTFTTESELEPYIALTHLLGIRYVSVVIENRQEKDSVHFVPDVNIEKMRKRFSIKL